MPESRGNDGADLRDHLHADLADFVQSVENMAMAQGDTALATEARKVHQRRLDALLNGEEVKGIARYELPDWCAESTAYGGGPTDRFTLTSDDQLVPDSVTPKFVPPGNRKQRRKMGWRGNGLNGDG